MRATKSGLEVAGQRARVTQYLYFRAARRSVHMAIGKSSVEFVAACEEMVRAFAGEAGVVEFREGRRRPLPTCPRCGAIKTFWYGWGQRVAIETQPEDLGKLEVKK